MDELTQGKMANALVKGLTECLNIGVDSCDWIPEPIKKFANKSLHNVDELVEESLVLDKMEQKFEDVKPKAITAVTRPDAETRTVKDPEVKEAAKIVGDY
jgi:hypothetical protein